jgi:hypothetical protein
VLPSVGGRAAARALAMKLRILDDSLRLRLSQGELQRLHTTGRVEAAIGFGPGPAQRLVYALVVDPEAQRISATLTDREIVVHVPKAAAHAWIEGNEVGLRAEQSLGPERRLALLLEKDWKCLVPRPGEEGYDGLPNPKASC